MVNEHRRPRRRRGGRGGASRQQEQQGAPPGPPAPPAPQSAREPSAEPRGAAGRNDSRRRRRDQRAHLTQPGAPIAAGETAAGRIHRNRPEERAQRDGRFRAFETPVPQDERSIELGERFRETQTALRDAKKTLDRRRAEYGDEPQWLVDQYQESERRFAQIATEWHEHLSKTGRKMVRR